MSLLPSPSLSPSFTTTHIPFPIIFPTLQSLSFSHPCPFISPYLIFSPFLFHPFLCFSILLLYLFHPPTDEPEVTIEGFDGNWFLNRKDVKLICKSDANPPAHTYEWKL